MRKATGGLVQHGFCQNAGLNSFDYAFEQDSTLVLTTLPIT